MIKRIKNFFCTRRIHENRIVSPQQRLNVPDWTIAREMLDMYGYDSMDQLFFVNNGYLYPDYHCNMMIVDAILERVLHRMQNQEALYIPQDFTHTPY
jgi:hypothetical protein